MTTSAMTSATALPGRGWLSSRTAQYCGDERGAVTADWVVLTAAVVGLGLAVVSLASGGVENLSEDTAEHLAGISIQTRFSSLTSLFDSGFGDGAGGWLGGTVASVEGFGEILQLGAGESAMLSLEVPDGATSASLSFDLIAADDLDLGDTATITVNGQTVSLFTDNHGVISVAGDAPAGMTVSVDQVAVNQRLGAGGHGNDSVATYTITVDDPGATLTLGVTSGADEAIGNEFFGLDNVSVSAN